MSFQPNKPGEPPKTIFGNPPAQGSNTPAQPSTAGNTGIFGAPKPTSSLFGNTSTAPATGGGLFGNTTSATGGTTGSSTAPATGGLFGGGGGSLFGNTPTSSTTPASTSTTPAGGSLFGGGSNAPSNTTATGTTSSLFGNIPKPAGGSLFGGGSTTPAASSTTPAAPSLFGNTATTSTTPAPASGSLFGGTTAKPGESAAPKTSLFGTTTGAGSTATPPSTTPAPGAGLFGLPAKPAESTPAATTAQPAAGASTTPAGTSSTGLFSGGLFNKPPAAPATSTTPAAGSATGTSTTPTTGLFGAKPEEKKGRRGCPCSRNCLFGAPKTAGGAKPATPAAPAPSIAVPPPSMLRGKTLEEIVNRWSSDLETHVREFNRFAAEVAVWDRALIENGNNLSALYSHITAAERQQDSIDQSLSHIEQQQKDLAATLDSYEKMSQELLGGQGGNLRTLDTGPADTERDKNYMLATDLHTQLDDLSGSLTQMIEAVNALSVSNKPNGESNDDPVSQISQILSSHLESLQWIDGAVREVEGKVGEIENRVKDSGYNLSGSTTQGKSRGFGLGR
ncbi:hypothetical protein NP233_g2496 [Leucocoprinus birnbaumii]|uniref:Nucleoporin NSP1 n=1 Tax=Leucocoprinus birnbaumii TaxID=56174 RepID=A0AAD5VYB3_9AGAR|nr:hypothetical protein NP233_g2496 [Leucocoprinus birnbaumii]